MKILLFIALFCVSSVGLLAQTDSLDAKIAHLLELSGAETQFTTAVDQMIGMQRQNPAYQGQLPEKFWNEFTEEIHKEGFKSLMPEMYKIYRDNYTEEEIDHQIAYFSDPITQSIVAKQKTVMEQSMAVGSRWGQSLSMKIINRLQEAVEDKN